MTLEPRLVKCNDLSRFVVVVVFSPDKLGICKRSYTPKYTDSASGFYYSLQNQELLSNNSRVG